MKSIAARYDGRPPSASGSRAPDADCSSSSVSILSQTPRSEASLPLGVPHFKRACRMAASVFDLLKLPVGLSTLAELAAWQKKKLGNSKGRKQAA